jgi:hypothetical protein
MQYSAQQYPLEMSRAGLGSVLKTVLLTPFRVTDAIIRTSAQPTPQPAGPFSSQETPIAAPATIAPEQPATIAAATIAAPSTVSASGPNPMVIAGAIIGAAIVIFAVWKFMK